MGHSMGSNVRQYLTTMTGDIHVDISLETIQNLPNAYKTWWFNLLREDPIHVLIETCLLMFIGYLVFVKRSSDWRKIQKQRLSEAEKEELIREWTPAPLTEAYDAATKDDKEEIVVHKVQGPKLTIERNGQRWHSNVLNFATHDFLGMSSTNEALKDVSKKTMNKYGCGSCGPRGFYGTIDVHLELEGKISKFCGTHDAIMYSDGASAVSSAVAAFAKRGDLLVVDEGVYESLQTGITLSRATVMYFKHNDMTDLRRVLEKVDANDERIGRNQGEQRRFIVTEGLYKNYGDLCPVDEIVKLKREFGYRLILDESFSFGAIGPNGKGAAEEYKMAFMDDVEIVTLSLENAFGSVGGICIGDEEVVDHQRLSGAGYCFSASAPPFTASAAIVALETLQEKSCKLLEALTVSREALYSGLKTIPQIEITSDERSPIAFVRLLGDYQTRAEEEKAVNEVFTKCLDNGVAVVSTSHVKALMHVKPPPSIRITVTAAHSLSDVEHAVKVLKKAVGSVVR